MIERKNVNSSVIKSIGHDAEKNILEVEFNSGSIYHHFGVTKVQHDALVSAKSIGKHYNSNFNRKNHKKVA